VNEVCTATIPRHYAEVMAVALNLARDRLLRGAVGNALPVQLLTPTAARMHNSATAVTRQQKLQCALLTHQKVGGQGCLLVSRVADMCV